MSKKKSADKSPKKMKQMLLSPNLTLKKDDRTMEQKEKTKKVKRLDKTKQNIPISPVKSSKSRPKPQAKASAKLKNVFFENKENASDVENNNSPTKISPEKRTENRADSPAKKTESPSSKNSSPTNNNSRATPSKMSPSNEGDISPTLKTLEELHRRVLPEDSFLLPNRPTSPRKSLTPRSGSSSPSKDFDEKGTGFKCKVCQEWFPNRYFQRKHMLIAHEDQLYECRVCSFNSVDPEKLKSHIIKLHVAKKEKAESLSQENQGNMNNLMDKKLPRKVMMEDGVSLGRDVTSKMRYVCDLCSRVYTSKYSLERHVRCHTLEKPYQCDVCDFSSSYREHMMRHTTSVHLIVHSDAPKEKYVPKKKRPLEDGDESVGSSRTPTPSLNPSESTDNLSVISDVTNSSMSSGSPGKKRRNILRARFECAVCGLRATHKTDLMDHIREKHPNAHIESLKNKDGSKVHLIVTNARKQKVNSRLTICCSYCSLIFHDTWKYKVHLRSHTGVKPFQCSLCDMKASSKMTVRDHIHRKHTNASNAKIILRTVGIGGEVEEINLNVPVREFKCDFCNELHNDKYSLKTHKLKMHPDAMPFSCTSCEYKEKTKAAMILHCNKDHEDEPIDNLILRHGQAIKVANVKMPTCDLCNKSFQYKSLLNLHTRLHTGEKELSCTHCDFKTNLKTTLSTHILKTHYGLKASKKPTRKKFSCSQCDFKSNVQSALSNHVLKTHYGIEVDEPEEEMAPPKRSRAVKNININIKENVKIEFV